VDDEVVARFAFRGIELVRVLERRTARGRQQRQERLERGSDGDVACVDPVVDVAPDHQARAGAPEQHHPAETAKPLRHTPLVDERTGLGLQRLLAREQLSVGEQR
jgi:hypothetical protein